MILSIDVGTTTLRAAVVDDTLGVVAEARRDQPPATPFPGLVEVDATALAATVLDAAAEAIAMAPEPIEAVGITAQRATTVVWDRTSGEPVGPGLGWQDLRTVGECMVAKAEHGLALAPNQSATKVAWLLANTPAAPDRDLCAGTIDSWLVWCLTEGAAHVTDHTNAGVTGLMRHDGNGWDQRVLDALGIPASMLPRLVDSSGLIGDATALAGAPPIAALVGDQQSSLIGQGCVRPGRAKATFGTGGMLDICGGREAPGTAARLANGTFPIVAWSRLGELAWGTEAIMLSAGTNVEWLRDDLGLLTSSAESHDVAATVGSSGGVVFVPALLGLGTPQWDYGARGSLFGLTRGTERGHVVRAVLEGVAQRGADLVMAAEADTGLAVDSLRVDGGMSQNPTFVQAVADATGRPVEVSPTPEATTRGAAFLAGLAVGRFSSMDDADRAWSPAAVVEPADTFDHGRWAEAVRRAGGWIPELSALEFS
ncbi:MAG: FGGY family carbohydrate kinase [Desertimonas sp.]